MHVFLVSLSTYLLTAYFAYNDKFKTWYQVLSEDAKVSRGLTFSAQLSNVGFESETKTNCIRTIENGCSVRDQYLYCGYDP